MTLIFNIDLSGFQGRLLSIEKVDKREFVNIEWDSISLKSMPSSIIEKCEEDGLDWRQIRLKKDEIEFADLRDTPSDVKKTVNELKAKFMCVSFGESGKRIQKILSGTDLSDEIAVLERWERYLEEEIAFPVQAKIYETQEHIGLSVGEKVMIKKIEFVDENYGIIVRLRHKRKVFDIPLCELDATKKNLRAHQAIADYRIWFDNR